MFSKQVRQCSSSVPVLRHPPVRNARERSSRRGGKICGQYRFPDHKNPYIFAVEFSQQLSRRRGPLQAIGSSGRKHHNNADRRCRSVERCLQWCKIAPREADERRLPLSSPWCMYLIFYKAGDIAGCVIWRRIWQPTWRYGGNEVAADDSGSRTANECVRQAGQSGFSVPAACPRPAMCAGSGSA